MFHWLCFLRYHAARISARKNRVLLTLLTDARRLDLGKSSFHGVNCLEITIQLIERNRRADMIKQLNLSECTDAGPPPLRVLSSPFGQISNAADENSAAWAGIGGI